MMAPFASRRANDALYVGVSSRRAPCRERTSGVISGLLVRCRLFRVQNAKAAPLGEHSRWLHDMAPRASRTIAATAPPTASCLPRSSEDANAAIGSSTASWCRSAMISGCSEARERIRNRCEWSSEKTTHTTSRGYQNRCNSIDQLQPCFRQSQRTASSGVVML